MDTGIKVGDCMKALLITISYDDTVEKAAKLMKKNDLGSVLVADGRKIEAIVTEGDIVRNAVALGRLDIPIRKVATKPLLTIRADRDLVEAAKAMARNNIRRLAVVDSAGIVVGMISERDILKISPALYDLIAEREHIAEEQKPSLR
jgi:CBS domain-containing protein